MRTSLFTAAAYCLLPQGVYGDCSGYPYKTNYPGRAGCFKVYVSCWTKFGDSCDLDFDVPDWIAGYEIVAGEDIAKMTGPHHGKIHCGSDDGSVQWKNYEEATVCPIPTSPPTDSPTVSPMTDSPTASPTTDSPTSSPTAAVLLSPASVRGALNELCATFQDAEEECLSKADHLMASLIEEAAATAENLDFGVPIANILRTNTGGSSLSTVLPILLVSAAAIFVVSVASRFRLQRNTHYGPVPDIDI